MKREILFKAKKKNNNAMWAEGYFHLYNKNPVISTDDGLMYFIIPETVCQYTGFKDTEGSKIFEGDRVEFTDIRLLGPSKSSMHDGAIPGWVGVIIWSESDGWLLDKQNEHNQKILEPVGNEKEKRWNPYIYKMNRIERINCKIIGNIND